MLDSHFEFAYVLYIIFISTVKAVTFGDFCSNDLRCHYPLICSNSSKCICPISSSSFWNTKQNTCLSCPTGSMEWKNEKCLLFIGSHESGVIYQKAKNACLIHSTQLLQINNHQDFVQFQYKIDELLESENANAFIEFLSNGVWINFTDITEQRNSYNWCDTEYENGVSSRGNCVRVMKKYSKNDNVTSICISRTHCNEKLSYICEKSAQVQDIENDTKSQERTASIIGELISDALLPMSQPQITQPPQAPQILYLTNSPQIQQQLLAQTSNSHSATFYIGLIFGFILFVCLLLCCSFGGFLLWKNSDATNASILSSSSHQRQNRTSIDSADSGNT